MRCHCLVLLLAAASAAAAQLRESRGLALVMYADVIAQQGRAAMRRPQ